MNKLLTALIFSAALVMNSSADVLAQPSDGSKVPLLAGTAVLLYSAADAPVQQWALHHQKPSYDRIANTATHFGEIQVALPALGTAYLLGSKNGNTRLRDTGLWGMESVVLADAAVGVLKVATHRHRPRTGDSPDRWEGPGFSLEHDRTSFPSAHSATAFAWATVVATQYSDRKAVPPLAYGAATLTALARVYQNEHWLSDVFVGSAIGYYTAKAVVRLRANHAPTAPTGTVPLVSIGKSF